MSINITGEMALAALEKVVEQRGENYRYTGIHYSPESPLTSMLCVYVQEDERGNEVPGCGVGFALINMGVPMDAFCELGINSGTSAEDALTELGDEGYVDSVSDEAVAIFSDFQYLQDPGYMEYGEILKSIKRNLPGRIRRFR